jgi:two-component system sensor histidine kinase YesM
VADKDDGYIKVWAEEQQGDLLLSVSDNGCGLPPDILRRLNSKDKRIPGGHLGLLNVDSIIRLNFGENYGISAQSVPGQGSCIRLRLPIWKERESDYAESIDRG